MEPTVLFDNGGHHSPQDEHMRNVVLSTKHTSGIGSIQRLTVLTLRAYEDRSLGAVVQQLNADDQSVTILLYPDELRLLAAEVEQWHRRYPENGTIGR